MVRPQYPLEALRQLRDGRVEAQQRELAEQLARCEHAEAALREAVEARRAHAARIAGSLEIEQAWLVSGGARGVDLLRTNEFLAAERIRAESFERAETEAGQNLARERARAQELRDELGRREADAKLVRNHETSFHQRAAERALRAEEEAALEQWTARRR